MTMTEAASLAADGVRTIDEFKEWTRKKIRPVFPHETLECGYGHLHAGGVALDYVVTIGCSNSHFQGMRKRAEGIDNPIMRRWLATREPQLFEADRPWPDVPAVWLESFRAQGLKNTAAHAVYDTERCVGTYHSFHQIPGRLGSAHVEALKQLAPIMHAALCGVIGLLNIEDNIASCLAGLSAREREIARWVRLGKTNIEIAGLCGLSENTVKHHLTNIFNKLAVATRTQLVRRLDEHEARAATGFATKFF